MPPLAIFLNIVITVAIVGIVVYWVRRFAVFRGYKAIEPDMLRLAAVLKAQPVREGSDVVLAGYFRQHPTIVRLSHRVDKPGLQIKMRARTTFSLSLMPKRAGGGGAGRVLMRTGSAQLDRHFDARSDQPLEVRMFLGTAQALGDLERACCSTQTGFTMKNRAIELTELTIPDFAEKHISEHLDALAAMAKRLEDMPGASTIPIEPLPPQGSSLTIRLALGLGLVALVALLLTQPYNSPASHIDRLTQPSGVDPIDAVRIPKLMGWHAARSDEIPGAARHFLRQNNFEISGHVRGDFSGQAGPPESAYLLIDDQGRRRVCLLSRRAVLYDAIFPRVEALARIPKSQLAKIQWVTAPQGTPDGDGLLVIENAENPAASLVLLMRGRQTYSAHPADFAKIDFLPEK